jgi:hypothetical protein
MRRIDIHGRRDYLATVERREGLGARMMLEDAFTADWEASWSKQNAQQGPK